jgi:fibronectin-binding autotransporter adhesin
LNAEFSTAPHIPDERMNQRLLKMGLLAGLLASPAHAVTLYWNPFGSYGGSANWDYDNTVQWYNGSTNLKWTDTTGADLAIFQGTGNSPPYTVTVVGNVTVNKLQFENGNYGGSGGITGGTITLAGAAPAIRAGNLGQYDTTINSTLAGVNGMILSLGNGNATTLRLGGSNTITGGVNFTSSTGTVILGSPTALGTGNALTMSAFSSSFAAVLDLNGNNQTIGDLTGDAYSTIQNGLASTTATLSVNQAGNTTYAGSLRNNGGTGGTLALTKDGAGTLTLTGAATYTGATTINAGTLAYSYGAATTFSLPSATLSGSGNLTATAGVLQFNGNMTLGGGQSYTQNGASGLYKGFEAVAASTTLTASSITMTGDLGKRNSVGNTVVLDTSTANGAINLNVSIGRSNVWYNLAGFTANAGTGALNVTGTNGYGQWDSPVSLTGALNITTNLARTGPAVFHATADSTISGNLGLNLSLYGFNDFNVDSSATMTVSGKVDGVSGISWGGINKLGAGTLSLTNAANSYGQGLQINAGTVEFSNNALRPRNPSNTSSTGYAVDFLGNGTLRWGAGNNTDLSASGQIKIGDGVTATFDTNGSSPTFAGAITLGVLQTGALTKTGAGTLSLAINPTYTGDTTVAGGTLSMTNTGSYTVPHNIVIDGGTYELVGTGSRQVSMGATPKTISFGAGGGTFNVNGVNFYPSSAVGQTLVISTAGGAAPQASLIGSAGINTDNDTVNFNIARGAGATDLLVTGPLWNTGAATKTGNGILTFAAANSNTGVTTVSGGTLVYQNAYASTSHVIASGGTIEFNVASGTADRASTTFSGAGTLLKTGAGTLQWGGTVANFNFSSGALIDVREGQLTAGSNNNEVWTNNKADLNVAAGATFTGVEAGVFVDALTGAGTIRSGYPGPYASTITFGVDNGSGTFSGELANASAAGNFVKTGMGTQILSGVNTYTGTTRVNQGTLIIDGTHNAAGLITVAAGATLGGSGSVGSLVVENDATLAPGNSAGNLRLNNLTLNQTSVMALELSAPDDLYNPASDFLTVVGDVDLWGVINITPLAGFGAPVPGDRWLIMTYGGGLADNGVTIGSAPGGADKYVIDTSSNGLVYINVVVPESGTGALLAIGLLVLLARRRP